MVSPAKKKSDILDLLGSGLVEALQLSIPLGKAIPFVGNSIEGSLQAVLFIIQAKDVRLSPCSDWVF